MDKMDYYLLDAKTYLVSHLDPLKLCEYFWHKTDSDSDVGYSLELLHTCIRNEIEHFNSGSPDIDDVFFDMVTFNGDVEIISIDMLEITIFVHCYDGEYREMPAIIMTVRKKLC